MAERLRAINPDAVIDARAEFYRAETSARLLVPEPDVVVDAIDNVLGEAAPDRDVRARAATSCRRWAPPRASIPPRSGSRIVRDADRSVRARPPPQPAPQVRSRLHAAGRRMGGLLRGAADPAARARLRRRRVPLRLPRRPQRRQRLRAPEPRRGLGRVRAVGVRHGPRRRSRSSCSSVCPCRCRAADAERRRGRAARAGSPRRRRADAPARPRRGPCPRRHGGRPRRGRMQPPRAARAGDPDGLAAYNRRPRRGRSRRRRPRAWPAGRLDRALWQRTLVEPYRDLLGAARARGPACRARRRAPAGRPCRLRWLQPRQPHRPRRPRDCPPALRRRSAADPRPALWLQWALPGCTRATTAELGGRPLDTVFTPRPRALGAPSPRLDELIEARVRAQDEACAAHLAGVVASAACAEAAWEVAEETPRKPASERFARGCLLAATRCGRGRHDRQPPGREDPPSPSSRSPPTAPPTSTRPRCSPARRSSCSTSARRVHADVLAEAPSRATSRSTPSSRRRAWTSSPASSVNDAWVMDAWARQHDALGKVVMLADGSGAFSKALGIDADLGAHGLGVRAPPRRAHGRGRRGQVGRDGGPRQVRGLERRRLPAQPEEVAAC